MSEIGVLLPVRLETRVDQDAALAWQLRLRVTPDEASVIRHRDSASSVEWQLLTRFWKAFDGSTAGPTPAAVWLDTPSGVAAWGEFAGAVGGPRACWMAAAFPPAGFDPAGKPILPAPPALDTVVHNRIGGFPPQLSVWAVFKGQPNPVLLKTQDVKPDLLVLRPPDKDTAAGKDEWWSSWAEAEKVGLAISCPLQGTPETLEALYVTGLGDARPADHFRARGNAGDFAVLAAGTPTNTVSGKPAAPLDRDPEPWRAIAVKRLIGNPTFANAELGEALSGKPDALPIVPGDTNEDAKLGSSLVRALWSPLWGHALRDIWGLGPDAERVSDWASRFLFPEGPLPPIRLAEQPYGMLPTTSLKLWKSAAGAEFPEIDKFLPPILVAARSRWAEAARTGGTVVGAKTDAILDLIGRDGVTNRYGSRRFLEDTLFAQLYADINPAAFNNPGFRAKIHDWARMIGFAATKAIGHEPARFFLGYGGFVPMGLPLVDPDPKLAEPLEALVQRALKDTPSDFFLDRRVLPGSLLLRLILWAIWYNRAAIALELDPSLAGLLTAGLLVEPAEVSDRTVHARTFDGGITEIDRLIQQFPNIPGDRPAHRILERIQEGLKAITGAFRNPEQALPRLERVFRATLDTAMHRLDPWVSGLAWQRMTELRNTGARYRLGVYGWVDGPILGKAGPTDGGLLHAPSRGQALAAVILRDKFLSEQLEAPARNPWDMKLTSKTIREADDLAEDVRVGAHLWEAVGRRVERLAVTTAAVNWLRTQFPGRPDKPDAAAVCNGPAAIAALLAGPVAGNPLIGKALADLLAGTSELRADLDAYGDLLVCEAVYQVVHGKGDAAGAAMDAAVGLNRPPVLDSIRTTRQGRSLNTAALCAFPFRDLPAATATTSPALLADPSVAAALVEIHGGPETWVWEAGAAEPAVIAAIGGVAAAAIEGVPIRLTLADLGMVPVDALALGPETLIAIVRAAAGIPDLRQVVGSGPAKHRQAREFVRAVGRHPCLWRDIATTGPGQPTPQAIVALDGDIRTDLLTRYTALRTAAGLLATSLANAADNSARRAALRAAARWGIAPTLPDSPPSAVLRAVYAPTPSAEEAALLPALVTAAAAAIAGRLQASPPTSNAAQIATAIAELASPGGVLAVLGKMDRADLVARTGLRPDRNAPIAAGWLDVISAVRPAMARFEAWQLEGETLGGFTPLAARSSNDDPWQKAAIAADAAAADPVGGVSFPRFVAGFGTATAWAAGTGTVAVGLIDAWTETAPTRAHTTGAAFGFNAPASKPPQAILLAAPPVADKPLDVETLRDIVIETRELAHARAATLEQLGEFQALVPLSALPGTGSTAFPPP